MSLYNNYRLPFVADCSGNESAKTIVYFITCCISVQFLILNKRDLLRILEKTEKAAKSWTCKSFGPHSIRPTRKQILYAYTYMYIHILIPRDRAPFGQHQELWPLAGANTGSLWFTYFPSLCTCSESSLINLIGCKYETNSLRLFRKSDPARGGNARSWPKGEWPLEMRMVHTKM